MTITMEQVDGTGAPPGDGPLASCLRRVADALAEVADARCWSVGDAELVELTQRAFAVRHQVDELLLRLVAEMQGRDIPRKQAATSGAAWLASEQRLSRREAGQLSRLASALGGPYERTRTAMAAGALTTEQGTVVTRALDELGTTVVAEERREAEAWLLDQARVHGPEELRRLGKRVFEVIDPDRADQREGELLEAEERRARERSSFTMRRCGDGTTRGAFRLPDVQADMLRTALEAMSAPRRWARAAQAPREPTSTTEVIAEPETRPYPVRMGQAFAELIEHLPTDKLPQAGGVAATVVVTMDAGQLIDGVGAASLNTGTKLTAGQARRLACNAGIIPAVLGSESECLDLGRTRRFHSRQQRIALGATQHGCVWPGCDRPPAWTEAHHLVAWETGGETNLQAALLCPRHHHIAHTDWQVRMSVDGIPEIIPPDRIDPNRRPRRHQRFRRRVRGRSDARPAAPGPGVRVP